MPRNEFTCSREDIPRLYVEAVAMNPLLGRVEQELKSANWTDEEIRTLQLLAACKSNASLTKRLQEVENRIAVIHR